MFEIGLIYRRRDIHDQHGGQQQAIVFQLVTLGGEASGDENADATPGDPDHPPGWYWQQPLDALRTAALAAPTHGATSTESRRTVYHRSQAVRIYVLRRATGVCEGCANPAPFTTAAGRPYLEPHHTRRISDGGPDDPAWVIALCPTCHRRTHHAHDAAAYNETLVEIVNALEMATAQARR